MADRIGSYATRTTQGPLSIADGGDTFFVAITAQRGPINVPVTIYSLSQFRRLFGEAVTYASGTRLSVARHLMEIWFSKRGSKVVVVRVVGAGAAIASTTVVDREGVPVDTLKVDAIGPGTDYNAYTFTIAAGTIANSVKLTLFDGDGNKLEEHDNLVMTDASLDVASDYIKLTNLDSVTAAPDNLPATGTYDLGDTTPGADDNDPIAADIVGTEALGVKTGLKAFRDRSLGRGFMVAPNLDTDPTVVAELDAQSEKFYRIPLYSSDAGASVAQAVTQRDAHAAPLSAFYFPRAVRTDPTNGERCAIPVTAHVVADHLNTIEVKGPGKAPAGTDYRVDFVDGLETQANGLPLVDEAVAEYLNANRVNAVWKRGPGAPQILGARTCSLESGWTYLHGSYLWILIADNITRALDRLTFENASDPDFLPTVEDGVYGYLADLHEQGAFRGQLVNPGERAVPEKHSFGFSIETDAGSGTVTVKIWFREAITGETIVVELAKHTA